MLKNQVTSNKILELLQKEFYNHAIIEANINITIQNKYEYLNKFLFDIANSLALTLSESDLQIIYNKMEQIFKRK